jgi:hypothetical protein
MFFPVILMFFLARVLPLPADRAQGSLTVSVLGGGFAGPVAASWSVDGIAPVARRWSAISPVAELDASGERTYENRAMCELHRRDALRSGRGDERRGRGAAGEECLPLAPLVVGRVAAHVVDQRSPFWRGFSPVTAVAMSRLASVRVQIPPGDDAGAVDAHVGVDEDGRRPLQRGETPHAATASRPSPSWWVFRSVTEAARHL